MDAHDQLLLSEGVCEQLDILTYPDVQVWRGRKKKQPSSETQAQVPSVSVRLVQTVQVPPQQSALLEVQVDGADLDIGDASPKKQPPPPGECLPQLGRKWHGN